MESDSKSSRNVDLYSLLKVDRNAADDEIHRAYKNLSTTFHPDKLPPATSSEEREQVQQVFLEFKRANDVLIDPVLRLAYDNYGEDGVNLIKRIQQQSREHKTRKEASTERTDGDDDDDEVEASLYERVERLLQFNPLEAKRELQRFMEQHDYHENLTELNQVQLACSMDFPPVVDLKSVFFNGRDYLNLVKQQLVTQARQAPPDERKYYQQRLKQEQGLVDYQINRIRDSQKGSVGFTLSSTQPGSVQTMDGTKVQPKWSMAMGASTDLVYPGVAEIVTLAGKEQQEQKHPASTFVNAVYQPVPDSQINLTANLTNDQSHQFVIGSARTFSNRSSCRYSLTFLSKSPLNTNVIFNFKSFRHVKDIGMTSGGVSIGANGTFLQWNAKWEAVNGKENVHKTSAKVSVGRMQGNSLELSYKLKSRKKSWLDDYILLPKSVEASTVLSRFPKVEGKVVHEITSLASHPTLAFGLEHDISLGCWTWIWELTYNNSSFRVPIPVLHLGTVTDPVSFYQQKFFYGIYCMLLQSLVADILQDDEETKQENLEEEHDKAKRVSDLSSSKTKRDAMLQVALMESVAERRRFTERQRNGLVISQATYSLEERNGPEIQLVTMDATTQLQYWVSNGRLDLPALPKSCLLGFYDLRTEIKGRSGSHKRDWRIWKLFLRRSVSPDQQPVEPQLRVRYSFQGYVYEVTSADRDALSLPSQKARLLGHTNLIQ